MGARPWNGCPGPPAQPVQALANFIYFTILIIITAKGPRLPHLRPQLPTQLPPGQAPEPFLMGGLIITNATTFLTTSAKPPEAAPVALS